MTLRGTMNLASGMMLVITLLFAYATWSSKKWIEGVDSTFEQLKPKITQLESITSIQWHETERRFDAIESKIDKILDREMHRS